jgi:hypothetical protein
MRTDLLKTLATNFGSNRMLAAKAIRGMYQLDPVGFPPAAAEVIWSGDDVEGAPFLLAILVANTDWLRTICDPRKYTLEQSLDLVRRARKLDPLTEVKLAKMLATLTFATEDETQFASRVLEVLEQSPDAFTTLPALRQLSLSSNPRVRSKAALLIGRIIQNPQWAAQPSSETDPRVSANAVESLWGVSTSAAREAFFGAAMNKHHRIAANGIVGLYLMGDECSIPFLFHLSRSENPLGRAAACWAMGHLEDPRFLPALARLIEDPDPVARKAAFKWMARVRQKMTQLRAEGALHVQIQDCECRAIDHLVRFNVSKDEQPVKGLDMRQFVVWNGPDLVEEFVSSQHEGTSPNYEITFQGVASPAHLVKVQVYAATGVGEDTGFETAVE